MRVVRLFKALISTSNPYTNRPYQAINNTIMSPFSFLSSSSSTLSDRITAFREAEQQLLGYAKTRFAHFHPHFDHDNHHFELFNTQINIPSVIKQDAATCQVHDSDSITEKHTIHGVKVINKQLSSLSDVATGKKNQSPLVLLHGYANGSLYFYRNLLGLSQHFGDIFALDMLGWGLSSRPRFDLITSDDTDADESGSYCNCKGIDEEDTIGKATKQQVSSAESFFVESLESWRKQHNINKMTLAGHSMGGYLSVAYAERYPQFVDKLILLSPVGVPEKQPDDETRINSFPFYIRYMIKTSRYLFNKGITPGAFLRSLPSSKSKAMVKGYVERRLPAISCPEEQKHLSDYLYQNSMMPGSGECCLSHILTAGAFAKIPLVNRIPNIQNGIEVHMVYGQNDWMSYTGGLDTQRLCNQKRLEWEEAQRNGNNNNNNPNPPPNVHVYGVKDASHLLMLDNYEEFNAALIIASGGNDKLFPNIPRPLEFACNEVLAATGNDRDVMDERSAAIFFRGPRWNRNQNAEDGKEKVQEDQTGFDEEKKEQFA